MRSSIRAYNNSLVKKVNRGRIVNTIRLNAPISRAEIADITGLDRKSITNFVDDLIAEGLVHENGVRQNDRGPSSIMLEFVPDSWHFVGMSLHEDHARAVVFTLPDRVSEIAVGKYVWKKGVPDIIGSVDRLTEEVASRLPGEIVGMGIAIPGTLERATGTVMRSVNIPHLNGIRLNAIKDGAAGENLHFENSARTKALAEKWFGLGRGQSSFACVDLESGVGCGIVHDRKLFRSPGDFMGEIGHLVVEPYGRDCACGNKGCLEAYVGERALLDILAEAGCLDADGTVGNVNGTLEKEVFRQAGQWLGRGLAPLVNILNPPCIILNGPLMRYADMVLPTLWKTLKEFSLHECNKDLEILPSSLESSDTLGAACLPLSDLFEVPGHFYV